MKSKIRIIVFVFSALVLMSGCSKSDSGGNAVLHVMLTDAPADYDQVLIDIQDVQIHTSENDAEGSWQSLEVNAGVYNLLDFRNGMDTLLGTIALPPGEVSQMRLILGPNNQLVTNGNTYDLDTPSGQQSGLKFNIHAILVEGITYTLWIDFDAARSIVERGNGEFGLKPVIRTYTEAISGAIAGNVSPADALPYIMAVANGDTLGTIAGGNGHFMINGVPAGNWTVSFDPVDPYLPVTIYNVLVETSFVEVMDTVYFDQP